MASDIQADASPMQLSVTDRFQIPGRGTVLTAILSEGGAIAMGDRFYDGTTQTSVVVRGWDMHTKRTPEGPEVGINVTESIPGAILPGATLTKLD